MHLFKTVLMASAVVLSGVAFASTAADARPAEMCDKGTKMKQSRMIINEKPVAGARRVGMVGGRPYPVIEGFKPPHSGGTYYTENTHTYYSNPAVNVRVRNSGHLNH